VLEEVHEHGCPRSGIAAHRRPELVRYPSQAHRTVARLEPVFTDDLASMASRCIKLDFTASAVHTDNMSGRHPGARNVAASRETLKFRRMRVERLGPTASAEPRCVVGQRMRRKPSPSAGRMVPLPESLPFATRGDQQHGPRHRWGQGSSAPGPLTDPPLDGSSVDPPRVAALDRVDVAGGSHEANCSLFETE